MDTEKLYEADPACGEFTGVVQTCQPGVGGFLVSLDRTAFYPEGGGQPADQGTLDGVAVTDVHEKGGVVFHTCGDFVEIGKRVTGRIDWNRRFDHMQQHSGEHILSGILCARYHCDNVGFHLGADTVTIDYNATLTWEQVLAAEDAANAILWADVPVEVSYPSQEALAALAYRSKKALTGQVRIVTVPGADCCACCGTHVRRAGQVGLIKVLSCQNFREGVRLEILCGRRAMAYLSQVYQENRGVAQRLSVKPLDTLAAVIRLETELAAAKGRMAELEEQVFAQLAQQQADAGDVVLFQPPLRADAVRRLADAVAQRCGGLAAVFAGEGKQFSYALVRADGADIAPLVKALNAALQGRGGGRGGFAQGSVQADAAAIQDFFQPLGG